MSKRASAEIAVPSPPPQDTQIGLLGTYLFQTYSSNFQASFAKAPCKRNSNCFKSGTKNKNKEKRPPSFSVSARLLLREGMNSVSHFIKQDASWQRDTCRLTRVEADLLLYFHLIKS